MREGRHPNEDRKELLLSLQALWRLDWGFVVANIREDEHLPMIESCLKVLQPPRDETIRISTLRTFGAVLTKLGNPLDEHTDSLGEFMYHAGCVRCRSYPVLVHVLNPYFACARRALTLHAGAEELLRVTDDLAENKCCMNLLLAILSLLAEPSPVRDLKRPYIAVSDVAFFFFFSVGGQDGRQAWKFHEKRAVALAVAEIALLVSLTLPRLDICSLAAKGLRLLAMSEQDPDAPPPRNGNEQASFRTPLLEVLLAGNTGAIVGRVEFQKRMRLTVGPGSYPCVTHLAVWKECFYRWLTLRPIVTGHTSRLPTDVLPGGHPTGTLSGTATSEVGLEVESGMHVQGVTYPYCCS